MYSKVGEKWLNHQDERSHWQFVTSGVSQILTLAVLFYGLFNDLDDGKECTLSKSVDDATLRGGLLFGGILRGGRNGLTGAS